MFFGFGCFSRKVWWENNGINNNKIYHINLYIFVDVFFVVCEMYTYEKKGREMTGKKEKHGAILITESRTLPP